jgi:hypothetical protein
MKSQDRINLLERLQKEVITKIDNEFFWQSNEPLGSYFTRYIRSRKLIDEVENGTFKMNKKGIEQLNLLKDYKSKKIT